MKYKDVWNALQRAEKRVEELEKKIAALNPTHKKVYLPKAKKSKVKGDNYGFSNQ